MSPAELEHELIKPFSADSWRELLPALLPGLSFFSQLHEVPLLSETERAVAKSLKQFGTARLADGKGIGLFFIEAKPGLDLTRNRVGLRQLAARWIDQVELHAALAFSYQPDVGFYRPPSRHARASSLPTSSSPPARLPRAASLTSLAKANAAAPPRSASPCSPTGVPN